MSITIDDLRALIRDQSGDLDLSQGQQERIVNTLNEYRSDLRIAPHYQVSVPFPTRSALPHSQPERGVIEQS
jgi:hypothetical protein